MTLRLEPLYGRPSPPITAYEWERELTNPLSLIGQDYVRLLMTNQIRHEDLVAFQHKLADVMVLRQKRADLEFQVKLEYRHEIETARLLESWAKSQAEETKVHTPESLGLVNEFLNLGMDAFALGEFMGMLIASQNRLDNRWNTLHQDHAKRMVDHYIQENIPLFGAEGERIELTPEKRKALHQALTPAQIAAVCKLVPHITEKILENTNDVVNPVVANVMQAQNMIGQIRGLALMHNHPDPEFRLTGAALLRALKNNPQAFDANKLNLHHESDLFQISEMIKMGASIASGLKKADERVKQDKSLMLEDLHRINQTPLALRPQIYSGKKRPLDEEEEERRKKSRSR